MDISNSSFEDDQSDSWFLVDGNIPEDGIDFEIVKELFDNKKDVETESVSSEVGAIDGDHIIPNISYQNEDTEHVEETKLTNTPNNEVEDHVEENVNNAFTSSKPSSSHSVRYRYHKTSFDSEVDLEKDGKRLRRKRKRNIHKCPFVTGVSCIGTLLTVCGLTLMLKSSTHKTEICAKSSDTSNVNSTLSEVSDEQTIWPSILEEERVIQKYCPKFSSGLLKHKNIHARFLKRLDRKIKQQVRGYDFKALKPTKIEKPQFFGAMNKHEAIKKCEQNKNETLSQLSPTIEKPFIENLTVKPVEKVNYIETSKENKSKTLNESISERNSLTSVNSSALKAFSELEDTYNKLRDNIINFNPNKALEEQNSKTNVQITMENKLNKMKEDNERLANIIEAQENLLCRIESRLTHKKRIYEKRDQLQQYLEDHLEVLKNRKTYPLSEVQSEPGKDKKLSDKLLDDMLLVTIKNNTINAANGERHRIVEQKCCRNEPIQDQNEYEKNAPLMKQKPAGAMKPKEKIELYLERQKLIAAKARKMEDEQHTQSNLYNKCDPKKSWIRKRNEIY